jgi:hypothetical protein
MSALEDFRHHFASLSDEALVAIKPDELVDAARQCYLAELDSRGLRSRAGQPAPQKKKTAYRDDGEDWVPLTWFDNAARATAWKTVIEREGVPVAVVHEHKWTVAVPAEIYVEVCELLGIEHDEE